MSKVITKMNIIMTGTVYYDGKRVTRDQIRQYVFDNNERVRKTGQGIIVNVCETWDNQNRPTFLVLGKLKKGSTATSKLNAVEGHNERVEKYHHADPIEVVDETRLWEILGLLSKQENTLALRPRTYDI